jgi:hypothetical protein
MMLPFEIVVRQLPRLQNQEFDRTEETGVPNERMADIHHDELHDAGHLAYRFLTAGMAIFTLQFRTTIQALFIERIHGFELHRTRLFLLRHSLFVLCMIIRKMQQFLKSAKLR